MMSANRFFTYTFKSVFFAIVGLALAACQLSTGGTGGGGQRVNANKPVQVAFLVPSGSGNAQTEALAGSLIKAAKMAVNDIEGAQIDLRVYATAGVPEQAANVAVTAVKDGAKIIVGPLFAEAANAVGVAVSGRNVNVLSFSNNTEIAGGNVFVLGNSFQNVANRIVGYAARKGFRNVGVVASQNTVGQIGIDAVRKAAARAGATFTGSATYEFSPQGVVAAIPSIKSQIQGTGSNAVVFTSDTAGALPMLAQLLPENGMDQSSAKFLGLTRWDVPSSNLAQSGLQGGWFTMPDPGLSANFRARYSGIYDSGPHTLAGIAYDGIAAVGALLETGDSDALTRSKLTQSKGFVGVNGVFRLLVDGTSERALAIAKVENGTAVIIDPAPRGFGAAGL